jgi:hypothetical protein
MSLGFAIGLVVVCGSALAIGFGCSMYQQRQRRLEVKSKWSARPPTRDGHGSH